jgi:peptide/nickel transport system substrate-binding protein
MKGENQMTRWRNLSFALLFVVGVSVVGAPNVGAASPSGGKTFTYDTYTQVMTGWDPSTGYSNEIIAMQEMYETLTRYNSVTRQVMPMLATSWSSSNGGKTWTFNLRHGVKFHTGQPVNAAAAKASIERTIKLNQGAAYIWGAVSSIATPSPYKLVFHLKYAAPLDLISSSDYGAYIYDTNAAGSGNLAKWFTGHDAGSGPYSVKNYTSGAEVELTLKSFPGYWGGWKGKHYKQVVFRVTPTASTSAQLVQSGQVNYVEQLTPQLFKAMKAQSGLQTTSSASWQNLIAFFNTAAGPMANLNFRKAVASAIDYKGILAALQGAGVRTPGIIPKGLIGYDASSPQYTHDLKAAKKYLAASPYAGKKTTLTLTYTQGDANEQLASQLIQSELSQIGISVKVSGLQWATQWAKAQSTSPSARQDIFLMFWWPDYADPYSWFINLYHSEKKPFFNLSYFKNSTMDKQIDAVEQTLAVNKAAGAKLYDKMQREIYSNAPTSTLYTAAYQRVLTAGIKGFVDNPAYPNVVFVYNLTP